MNVRSGNVEVETAIENHGADPMPVGIGFHPYFQLHDVHRDEWHVHFAARDHMVLNAQLIPTGERKPLEFADPHASEIAMKALDKPTDRFLDHALWLTANDLRTLWLPQFLYGK